MYMLTEEIKKTEITNIKQIKERTQPTWIVGGNPIIFDYYGIKVDDLKAKGGGIMPPVGSGPTRVSREKRASGDVFIGTGLLAKTPEQRSWSEDSHSNAQVVLDFEDPKITSRAQGR